MKLRRAFPFLVITGMVATATPDAFAWSPALEHALYRDALRLLPRSLAQLMRDREREVLQAAQRPPQGLPSFRAELASGSLQDTTAVAFDAELQGAAEMMKNRQLSAGLVRMGAVFRKAADIADPVLAARPGELPPEVVAQYYAFLEGNLEKIPVVLDDEHYLKLGRGDLPAYWRARLLRSREDAPVIRTEMYVDGRVTRHETIDYRSPVFGVGSLAYSRAVTGIAATWLATWRAIHGDMGRIHPPYLLGPVPGNENSESGVLPPLRTTNR
jgi:hypothetical protein